MNLTSRIDYKEMILNEVQDVNTELFTKAPFIRASQVSKICRMVREIRVSPHSGKQYQY